MASLHGRPAIYPFLFQWPDVAAFLLVHLIVPLAYILFFVRYWREAKLHPEQPWDRLMLLKSYGTVFVPQCRSLRWLHADAHYLPARSYPSGVVSEGALQN